VVSAHGVSSLLAEVVDKDSTLSHILPENLDTHDNNNHCQLCPQTGQSFFLRKTKKKS